MTEPTTDVTETGPALAGPRDRSYTSPRGERERAMRSGAAEPRTGRGGSSREPLPRTDRIQIVMLGGVFAMLAATLGAGAVGFSTLSGQILGLQQQVGGFRTETHQEIGGLRAEMHREIGGLRAEMHREIGGLRAEMREEFGGLRAEMHQEIGGLRAEMREEFGDLTDRMTRLETLIETHLVRTSDASGPASP